MGAAHQGAPWSSPASSETCSQFLHGEQGALFAAAQLTTAVRWLDGKLYGSTQVADEGRHVEVFHRYLGTKLGKRYEINDNLYVIVDALMSDSRWDIKFLGMQILVEGLALGAFGMIRRQTREPLLRELLRYVVMDEARHVHFGVLALEKCYTNELGALGYEGLPSAPELTRLRTCWRSGSRKRSAPAWKLRAWVWLTQPVRSPARAGAREEEHQLALDQAYVA